MDNHNRRLTTSANEDIITNFPEHLTDQIIERLPIEDAIRTSVLSNNWRYKWTTIKILNFDQQFSTKLLNKDALHHNGFIRIINKIMINHNGPILKFVLYIPSIFLDCFQEVDQWMLICSRNNIRELVIINFNRLYLLASCVFSCLELRRIEIRNCIFKPPRGFQGFPNLEQIHLINVNFKRRLVYVETVIKLPQLKELKLENCIDVNNFNIKAEKLQTLWVINCPDAVRFWLVHSECLDEVRICLLKPPEDPQRVKLLKMDIILGNFGNILSFFERNFRSIVSFTIDGFFVKFLAAENFQMWIQQLPHPLRCLNQLEFQNFSFGDLDQVKGGLRMLRNSPNLKVLRVTHVHMGINADLESTSSYLDSADCLHQTLLMLQNVEITSLEGTRPELLFIKLLLHHSPRLENMTIRPKPTVDAEKRLNIAKDVMMFPRASAKAKIVYLDPLPYFVKNV